MNHHFLGMNCRSHTYTGGLINYMSIIQWEFTVPIFYDLNLHLSEFVIPPNNININHTRFCITFYPHVAM